MVSRPMKDSGVEWIGEIPIEWEKIKIKHIVNIQGGSGFPINLQGKKTGEYPFYKNSDFVNNNRELIVANNYVDEEEIIKNQFNVIPPGAIVMSKIGESMKKNHRKITIDRSIIDNNLQALVIKNEEAINYIYFYYLMNVIDSNWFDNKGAVPSINNNLLRNQVVYIGSNKEQQKIASFLDEKIAHIDNILEDTKKSIEYLKAYKQSLITETVTKGLNANVEMKDSGIEWIGEIPKEWNIAPISRLFFIKAGGDAKPEFYSDNSDKDHPYPVYTNTHIENKIYAYTSNPLFPEKSITVSGRGAIGKAFYRNIPFDAIIRLIVLVAKFNLDSRYFAYFISFVIPFNTGSSAVGQLSTLQISPYELAVPPVKEQQQIADYLDEKTAHIDSLLRNKEKMLEELEAYKKSLIYEYVTGKKEVQ